MEKSVHYFGLLVLIIASSCNDFKSDHPQAEINTGYTTSLTPEKIISYTDSIDQRLNTYQKHSSLIYLQGNFSFYVDKYSENNKPILFVEHSINGLTANNTKHLYFKNDSLILEKQYTANSNEDNSFYKQTRTFLRNNTAFKNEERTASSISGLESQSYVDIPLAKMNKPAQNYIEHLATLNDVVAGNDKFEMIFENIATFPDSRYINLKSKLQNGYTASILVKDRDTFIDSLLNSPIDFKNQNLNINWVVKDNEAVYVPVSNNTSASGLNK